ncbi:YqcI/YcgG family protein [Corynebacterium mastitidis]|uniref:YqcI/YcgG family protein n=1 Tax=Corynebacterium mastitidis TaxID=161890 RepID=UPI00254F7358|nr:YqcI/YcgG family protein [Corynebacterium mastitidis]MDK8450142.1 YqcI/YcgG family protein [Corynebacterium mastitidis]
MGDYLPLFDRFHVPSSASRLMDEFAEVVLDKDFPCFFARSAHRRGELLYGFADVSSNFWPVVQLFDAAVRAIGDDGERTIIMWVINSSSASLEEDHRFTARIMEFLLHNDPLPWPEGVPLDPADPEWDFWYRGVGFFINVSTPHHVLRRSRNLGSAYTLVVQARSSFTEIDQKWGNARGSIRSMVEKYDLLPLSPALGVHGEKAEIDQFFLGDDNETCVSGSLLKNIEYKNRGGEVRCPLHRD